MAATKAEGCVDILRTAGIFADWVKYGKASNTSNILDEAAVQEAMAAFGIKLVIEEVRQ